MKMSLGELMLLWNSKTDPVMEGTLEECEKGLGTTMDTVEDRQGTPEDEADDGVQEDDEDPENDDLIDDEQKTPESLDLTVYRKIILEAPAFKTLVAALQRECLLVTPESDFMREIGEKLLKHLPLNPRISRKRSAEIFKMKCTVNWDPITFLITQEYTQQPADAFETAITLTGSNRTAQAVTCGRYLCQTWPSSGEHIMALIKGLVRGGFDVPQSRILPDGTEVVAELQGAPGDSSSMLYAEVTGTAYSIIEAVEQLAWLGAALRSSPIDSGVAYCRPVVDCSREVQGESETEWRAEHHCKIDYIFRTEEDTEENGLTDFNGQCWHHLFRNPVVVEGYPIPRRPESTAAVGLEIPLNMMAGLAQAHRISTFNGWTVLKGWSTLLVPTEQNDGLVFWHLKHRPDGERISFRECENFSPIKASIPALEKARHVLGWCTEMRFFGGAADASYNVRPSRLPETSEDCLLGKAYISSGHMISGGHPFSIGRKDIPVHISRHSYIRKLRWIAQKFVVLWDEGGKRGWLVNGTSALLHLVRAAMKQASEDHFKSYLLFDPGQLQESRRSHEPTAAVDVLMDPSNRALKVYQEKDDYIRFENQVEHFYDLLEKIIDHQYDAVQKRGLNYSNIPRAYLEGWDFHELAVEADPVHPRVAILESIGKSWVDFTRSIYAVTLFGHGFGEIIKPTAGTCWQWARLPKGRYYLSACMSDLKDIMKTRGDPDSIPMKLVDNILWHNTDSSFVPCKCKGEDGETHSDFAQVLLPSSMAREMLQNMSRTADADLNNGGAVIFGQNRELEWFWGDTGEPSRKCEEVLMSQAFPESPSHDSGIGKSVASSTSKISESMAGLRSRQRSVNRSLDGPQSGNVGSEDTGILSITGLHERGRNLVPEDYKVGIVCALYLELMSVRTLFDSEHEELTITDNDPNYYALGRIGRHNVVAASLPDGEYGTNSATCVAWNMKRTFTGVKFCLLVGIGGGVPSSENDIRLGDVVVSRPTGTLGGVLNYELGKALGKGGFQPYGCLPPAPGHLMSAVSDLRSDPRLSSMPLEPYLEQIASRNPEYRNPGAEKDRLFASDSIHLEQRGSRGSCDSCASRGEVERPARLSTHPKIHYGLIASGNKVVRDAEMRDQLANQYNVLCFEMEAAGVMLALPCLVIRGICDYADSHKNKVWQEYAAGAAAAYAKLLLSRVRPSPGQWEDQRADFESASRHQPPKRERTASMAASEPSSGPKRTRC
jgi:nucleoside phosphorylase